MFMWSKSSNSLSQQELKIWGYWIDRKEAIKKGNKYMEYWDSFLKQIDKGVILVIAAE